MPIRVLIRWSGIALILGGLCGVFGTLLDPVSPLTSAALGSMWVVSGTIDFIGNTLIMIGLVGLYIRLADKAGLLGLIGFVLSIITTILAIALTVVSTYVFPYIAQQPDAPTMLADIISSTGPLPLLVPFGLALTIFDLGFILLGVAIVRAGVLSRWAGWLLAITTILGDIFPFPGDPWVLTAGLQIAWSVVLIWLGVLIVRPALEAVRLQPAV